MTNLTEQPDTYRGHEIEEVAKEAWIYKDTKQLVSENKDRGCGFCKKENTLEGRDACLGSLIGVDNACCGHGNPSEAYIVFTGGLRIAGFHLTDFNEVHKKRKG